MKVLISGAGIAGPTLAYWLLRYGFEPTIVERAPSLRTGGYIVDFWGVGFEVAARMGLVDEIKARGYDVQEVRVVDAEGKQIAGFPTDVFARVTQGHFASLPRGALAEAIYKTIDSKVETIFDESVEDLLEDKDGILVSFRRSETRRYDLVVGADGLHSKVRELAFRPDSSFEKYLGYKVAAFETSDYRPRDELVYVMFTQVHKQVTRFAMRGDRTMFLFTFADSGTGDNSDHDVRAQKSQIREQFGDSGWECPQILAALDRTDELYFDRVSQIVIPERERANGKDRVVLIGDAAAAVSLLAGEGSGLAMAGAYILAGELHRSQGNYREAIAKYHERFAPFVRAKQNAALRLAGTFAPGSAISLFLRNELMNLLRIRWVANLALSRTFTDHIELPDYA